MTFRCHTGLDPVTFSHTNFNYQAYPGAESPERYDSRERLIDHNVCSFRIGLIFWPTFLSRKKWKSWNSIIFCNNK
jgi:hypothetical protein